jgi:hypothetical protein
MSKKRQRESITDFNRRLESVSQIDWARLASWIDSEGTIYINRVKPTGRMKSPQHRLSVVIANASPLLQCWLTVNFGGSVSYKKPVGWTKHPNCYEWRVNGLQAYYVLTHCQDFMIIKREQALVGIALQATMTDRSSLVDPAIIAVREQKMRLIKSLNAFRREYAPIESVRDLDGIKFKLASAPPSHLAQLATFIDAEGNIYINRTRPKDRLSPKYTLRVSVINTSALLLNWLQRNFGGGVWRHGDRGCFIWIMVDRQAEFVIRYCLPYFLVKREQADLAVEFRNLMQSACPGVQVAGDELLRRDALRDKIHELNSPPVVETNVVN